MYKTITTFLCLFICFTLSAQTLKKVKQLSEDKLYREVFYIDKETGLKKGEYSKYKAGIKKLIEKGNYYNGLKQGVWYFFESEHAYWAEVFSKGEPTNYRKFYYYDKLCAKGQMIDGVKTGIWNFYDVMENKMMTYDYDNSKVLWACDEIKFEKESIYLDEKEGTRPFVIGGERRLLDEIQNIIPYFKDDDYEFIEGKVVLTFTIDKNGKAHSPKIVESEHKNLSNEALHIYKLVYSKLEWMPATVNGVFTDWEYLDISEAKFKD